MAGSHVATLFSQRSRDSRESPQICDSQDFCAPKRDSQKKGVQVGNPEMIRAIQAIRANLRIDSCESGHLR